ncbi:multidrug effflux MFS transporter [Microlunatus soli]|uniref:MFS transporter, DHA1 family, bicyclomycin/chloramphenicol resistance protein n=1 Tax=Microlunatus soli TaxID=630515 RepID=A0A1H1NZL7_9ACTN|nr:multidrug effflux MFS transporter [Microlunatus soli]SDS04418.1 MFS transporter, DHA1 family, bicyclomycin/chloramphenicol resistance protein [Microlunatus soli]
MVSSDERRPAGRPATAVSTVLVLTLALQCAVPPFATDTYTPAIPRVTAGLDTSASLVGLTLTAFFIGMALGQLFGGPLSDQRGRRLPMIAGGLLCTLGAIGCALAPSIGLLIMFRVLQGFGGGVAAVVARAVVVDVARGDTLARVMSIMMALGGLAPMIAPVVGGAVLTVGGSWRTVFWVLAGFGLAMMITAIVVVGESLPPDRRHGGGLARFADGLLQVIRIRSFVGYALTGSLSGFTMMAYIANSSYVLQQQKGLQPMPFALFFAATALSQVLLSVVNARIVGRFRPRRLIGVGLSVSAAAVAGLAIGVFALGTPLVLTCIGFLLLMGVQAFVFGNASALAASQARQVAGSASAVTGVAQAVAMSVSAPLASSGGSVTAVPMIWVMIAGISAAIFCYLVVSRPAATTRAG